jgi:4-diphosphocytidyl-2-C-methyl-D-erythritol kinase
MQITLKAHAKLNLDLRVIGRRPDGYHELRTVFQTIALHDTLVVEHAPRAPFSLAGDASRMPLGDENLAWKAAEAIWRAMGRTGPPKGARITIRKRIPSQAGLGGGSSDAAAALTGLNTLWGDRIEPDALMALAASLGADVPFFLVGGTALGLGRGDDVYPLMDVPTRNVVIVRPAFGVATRDAYAWLSDRRGKPRAAGTIATDGRAGFLADASLRNDFEQAVEARHPGIRQIRQRLVALGATVARLSGSGSAVFGLFDTSAEANRAAGRLARPNWTVLATRTRRRGPRERQFLSLAAARASK